MLFALGVGLLLAIHNNVLALTRVPDRLYLPVNVAVGAALVAAARGWGLSWSELGLGPEGVGPGLRWGGAAAAIVAAASAAALRFPLARELFADLRLRGLTGPGLAFRALVRMPIGTSLFEEMAFRGVLFGALARQVPVSWAVAISAVLFGLSHVGPAVAMVRANPARMGVIAGLLVTVAATTVGGVLFALLRVHTLGIVAPALAHWAINASGAVTGSLALGERLRVAHPPRARRNRPPPEVGRFDAPP